MKLEVVVTGNGPDVALLHGWGVTAGVWQGLAAALAEHFRVHAFDLAGYCAAAARAQDRLLEYAERAACSMPRPCHVVGWSLGALVAMTWARAAPQQVRRMVLLAATPSFACRDGWTHGVEAQVLEAFGRELVSDCPRTLRRFVALQVLGDTHARGVAAALRRHVPHAEPPRMEALNAGLRILVEADLREALAAITQRTLVVHGDRDRLIPPAAGRYLGEHIPGARFELLRGAAHAPFLSQPRKVNELLTTFLHG